MSFWKLNAWNLRKIKAVQKYCFNQTHRKTKYKLPSGYVCKHSTNSFIPKQTPNKQYEMSRQVKVSTINKGLNILAWFPVH